MGIPSWLEEKRASAKKRYQNAEDAKLRYGLTIRLSTKGLALKGREDEHSEQILTLEHDGCEVYNLFDELDRQEAEHLLTTLPKEQTQFTDFAEAFFDMGLLIIIRKNQKGIVDLTRTLTSNTFKEHILVVAEEGSNLTIIDKHSAENTRLKAATVEIFAEKDAHVKYATIQALPQTCFDISSYRAKTLGGGAKIDWFIASLGSTLTHANVDTYLEGEGSESRSYGVFLGTDQQQIDVSASTFHRADKSGSDMYTRGVLLDKAKAVYRGNIDIAAEAFDCNGYQTEETLLIGEHAVADAIPNLEIRNNQVSCSHGATIGRIDDEHLFYLESRGIPTQQAVKMIIEGFFEPVAAKLEWPELFTIIQPLVHERVA